MRMNYIYTTAHASSQNPYFSQEFKHFSKETVSNSGHEGLDHSNTGIAGSNPAGDVDVYRGVVPNV